MKKYTFTCTCGDKITVEAATLEEAKTKFSEMMTELALREHFDKRHPGQEMPAYDVLMEGAMNNLIEETSDAAMVN